jgi:hypothetical protein
MCLNASICSKFSFSFGWCNISNACFNEGIE